MMKYLFTPIEQHSDLGLGAMADNYQQSAEKLIRDGYPRTYLEALPTLFLFRHSCELYLKSLLIICHKIVGQPLDLSAPQITINGKIKELYRKHSIGDLFQCFSTIIKNNKEQFNIEGKTNWVNIPQKLIRGINKIESLDRNSVYFRYPNAKKDIIDTEKSPMYEMSPSELSLEKMPPVFATIFIDEDRNPIQVFNTKNDDVLIKNNIELFKSVASTLGGANTGMRVEYLDGY